MPTQICSTAVRGTLGLKHAHSSMACTRGGTSTQTLFLMAPVICKSLFVSYRDHRLCCRGRLCRAAVQWVQ
eukprot:6176955-Pleurochrysis_carterae.AAC.2